MQLNPLLAPFEEGSGTRKLFVFNEKASPLRGCLARLEQLGQLEVQFARTQALSLARSHEIVDLEEFVIERRRHGAAIVMKLKGKWFHEPGDLTLAMPEAQIVVSPIKLFEVDSHLAVI